MSLLTEVLKNEKVSQICYVHDYIQLAFGSEKGLTIYNDYAVEGGQLTSLMGSSFLGEQQTPHEIVLFFSNDIQLHIDMKEEAWHGPEAMVLNSPEHPFIVWN